MTHRKTAANRAGIGRRLTSAAALFASAILSAAAALPARAQGPGDPGYTGPILDIPVPGVEFSGYLTSNGFITIPWLSQYISGVYTFLISVVGMLAAVMLVIGGFQYVTSAGDKGRIGAAKKRMTNAFVGLLLAFGSYTILYFINPALVQFEGLRVTGVTTDLFDAHMATTQISTAGDNPLEEPSGPPPGVSTGEAPGSYTHQFTTCPFDLPKGQYNAPITASICASTWKDDKPKRCTKDSACPSGDVCAGKPAFYRLIQESGVVTARSVRERVVQIADIADACNVNLGSCGEFAGTVSALAGVDNGKCLTPPNQKSYNCNDNGRGRQKVGVTQKQREITYYQRCDVPPEVERDYKKYPKPKKGQPDLLKEQRDAAYAVAVAAWREKHIRKPCASNAKDAIAVVRKYFEDERDAGRLKGWPDEWAKQLQPGDYVTVYNGNTDTVGSHALIFVGWTRDGNSMQVIQGGNGGSGANTDRARPGTICVKTGCGKKMVPLLRIYSPD